MARSRKSRLASVLNRWQRGGAELLALCANTAHVHADAVQAGVDIPLVSIIDAVGAELARMQWARVGVLCTARARDAGIFDTGLSRLTRCQLLLPDAATQDGIDQAIHDGAASGRFDDAHSRVALDAMVGLKARGAQAIVLGCTELPVMLAGHTPDLTCLGSTRLHVQAIMGRAFDLP